MNQVDADRVWIRCRACSFDTEHDVRNNFETMAAPIQDRSALTAGQGRLFTRTRVQVLECRVCTCISFRQRSDGDAAWTVYPNPEVRRPCMSKDLLPVNVRKLYLETVQAVDGGCLTLTAAGMRAVVEAICQQHGCKGQDLQEKISKLKRNSPLSACEANALHMHRVFGNEALHKMQTPSLEEVLDALEILEHLLKTLFELPHRTKKLTRMHAARIHGELVAIDTDQRAN